MLKTGNKVYDKPQLTVDQLSAALYQANEELRVKNEELIAMQQAQREMFANISHDLRSPITAIRSAIEYITSLDHLDEEELKPLFLLLNTRIVSLEGLINDIFLMTRLDSNTLEMKMENVSIGAFLEEYYYSSEGDCKYQKRSLKLEVPTQFNIMVQLDIKKVIRVLDNLFTNAYKYSKDNDSIILGARESENEVTIWVKDSGIGIESELLDKIFDRTYTVSSARTPASATGAGLGLSIAKSIIEKHGGRIWCESKINEGSTFYFTLPKEYKSFV
ncbi:MAG: HAMP domain-containing sensor histidine kinase [Clostridiales bacterium]|nr:HAMP domain-containing sensor histidine kinase [Clostridiales bacterium]